MKIVIDKESIIKVFAVAFYAVSGGDYSAVKDLVKELLEKIGYEPYEERPQGDLISREQIRKMLNEAFGCENATKYGNKNAEQQALSYSTLMLYEIANIVEDCCDNAPTVKLDESMIQGVLNKRCMTAVTNEYLVALHGNGRPKGEWTVSGYIDTCRGYVAKCPFCKEDTVGGGNFCKHCGADMRGNEK